MILPRLLAPAAIAAALLLPAAALAQKVILTAEIDAAQETGGSTSTATGEAVMKYDFDTNTFDLEVRIKGFTEPLAASHIHEAIPGEAGPVVLDLGAESAYKRSGERLRLKIRNRAYTGDPAELLTGGAYLNFHTAAFPAGAIRGQLLPHSADFITNLRPPAGVDSKARGVAKVRYDFLDDTIDVKITVANFRNTLTGSYLTEDVVRTGGSIVVPLGDASAYRKRGKTFHGDFRNLPVLVTEGDPIDLLVSMLDGRGLIVVESDVYPDGEVEGRLRFRASHRHRR